MARPRKENALYHSHDADMRNDDKILALRSKFNNTDGYAIYNMMLEVLTDSHHFEIKWNDTKIMLLAVDFRIEPEYLKQIVDFCISVELFQTHDDYIYSQQHKDRFKSTLNRRNKYRNEKAQKSGVIKKENKNIPDDGTFDEFEQERQDIFNNLDEQFRIALKNNMGIERPYLWANRKIPVEYFDLVDFIIRIVEDVEWRTIFCRNNKIDKNTFLKHLYSFVKEIINQQSYYGYDGYNAEYGENNFISHFSRWTNKKINNG